MFSNNVNRKNVKYWQYFSVCYVLCLLYLCWTSSDERNCSVLYLWVCIY